MAKADGRVVTVVVVNDSNAIRLRRATGSLVVEGAIEGLARLGRLHPNARPARHGVSVTRDVPYTESGLDAHLADVYRPLAASGPLPVVAYFHGGGFRILSKDTHWVMGLAFARRGYLVLNFNYRLAPRWPYPAALEDACAALLWAQANAARFGGDPERLVLAGESAGGNLVTALAVATSWRRPEPWARAIFDAGVRPRAVVAACGILQVSAPERLWQSRRVPEVIRDRVVEVSHAYLDGAAPDPVGGVELADPLCVVERAAAPERALPPMFAPVGGRDLLEVDSARLAAAVAKLGGTCETKTYPGEGHAFHALVWRKAARECWRDTFAFLQRSGV